MAVAVIWGVDMGEFEEEKGGKVDLSEKERRELEEVLKECSGIF